MTVFEIWVGALSTIGVAAVCLYLWSGYRHDTAITQRDQAVADVAAAQADIERANANLLIAATQNERNKNLRETDRRELEQITGLYTTEVERCLELEQRIACMIDPDDITPGLERLNRLGQAAYQAWQTAGGRGRTTPERELLNEFAPVVAVGPLDLDLRLVNPPQETGQ